MAQRMTPAQLIEAIRDFYGDTSRSKEQTKDALQKAQVEIPTLLETIASDEA